MLSVGFHFLIIKVIPAHHRKVYNKSPVMPPHRGDTSLLTPTHIWLQSYASPPLCGHHSQEFSSVITTLLTPFGRLPPTPVWQKLPLPHFRCFWWACSHRALSPDQRVARSWSQARQVLSPRPASCTHQSLNRRAPPPSVCPRGGIVGHLLKLFCDEHVLLL